MTDAPAQRPGSQGRPGAGGSLLRWALREMLHRKGNLVSALLAVIVAVGSVVGAWTLLKVHDARTRDVLAAKRARLQEALAAMKDNMRKSTLKLSFNLVILPKGQNLRDWHIKDYADTYMPEEYAARLANSRIITVRHLLPVLQQKVKWPEKKRTIILVGTRGEIPKLHKPARKPLLQPVPAGKVVLGYELHRSLNLKVGDKVRLMGREFTVHKCYPQRGSKDDITVWIPLHEAQELLNKKGLINGILALECLCFGTGPDLLGRVRADVAKILPETQVLELASKALARAEARLAVRREARAAIQRERRSRASLRAARERFAGIFIPLVLAGCAVWIAISGFSNVRERRAEIGILRALGMRSRHIMVLFLSKSALVGLVGGVLGLLVGTALGSWLGAALEGGVETPPLGELFDPVLLPLALAVATLLTVAAGWLPAAIAARQDPAEVLGRE